MFNKIVKIKVIILQTRVFVSLATHTNTPIPSDTHARTHTYIIGTFKARCP